ncbi:MAG TPA: hypothetical protein VKE98_05510 [Gemmataceae bacterium]|nr:hypothetical protein [Gemmataceae bacterium]
MKKFIAALALLIITGFSLSARQQSIHDRQLKVYERLSLIRGPLANSKLVIRDEAAWKLLVARNAELAKLKVDFSKQMVLVVAEAPRGRGKYLSHVEVRGMFACIPHVSAVLHYNTTDPREPILQDIIFPNHFIVVESFDAPVEFSEVVHSPWLLQPASKIVGQEPATRDYIKTTVRVEILGRLTYIPPTRGESLTACTSCPTQKSRR